MSGDKKFRIDVLKIFERHNGPVTSMLFFPPDILVTSSIDKTIRIWDFEEEECLKTISVHRGSVNKVIRCGEDEFSFISCSFDGKFYTHSIIPPYESKKLKIGDHVGSTRKILKLCDDLLVCITDYGNDPQEYVTIVSMSSKSKGKVVQKLYTSSRYSKVIKSLKYPESFYIGNNEKNKGYKITLFGRRSSSSFSIRKSFSNEDQTFLNSDLQIYHNSKNEEILILGTRKRGVFMTIHLINTNTFNIVEVLIHHESARKKYVVYTSVNCIQNYMFLTDDQGNLVIYENIANSESFFKDRNHNVFFGEWTNFVGSSRVHEKYIEGSYFLSMSRDSVVLGTYSNDRDCRVIRIKGLRNEDCFEDGDDDRLLFVGDNQRLILGNSRSRMSMEKKDDLERSRFVIEELVGLSFEEVGELDNSLICVKILSNSIGGSKRRVCLYKSFFPPFVF